LDNATVQKIDSEWQCIKCEIFHVKLSRFIDIDSHTSHFRIL